MKFYEKTISEKSVYEGKIVNVELLEVELPNGKISKREIVRHRGAVAVVAVTENNKILLVEQFRKALDRTILEMPAGKLEEGEEPIECGIRELEEETGYKVDKENVQLLGKIHVSPGYCDECIYIIKAENLKPGQMGGDEDGFININEYTKEEIIKMIVDGKITDSKTISSFMYLQ